MEQTEERSWWGGHPKWKQRDMDDAQGASPAGKEQALWAAAVRGAAPARTAANRSPKERLPAPPLSRAIKSCRAKPMFTGMFMIRTRVNAFFRSIPRMLATEMAVPTPEIPGKAAAEQPRPR